MSISFKYSLLIYFSIVFQSLLGQNLSFEQFTERDGLPSLTTYNITQDELGIMWIGTENGLVSFDGDNFIRYSHPDLVDNDIVDISYNKNGRLYFINISGQLGYFENNEIKLFDDKSFPAKSIRLGRKDNKDYVVTASNGIRKIYEIINLKSNKTDFVPTDIFYFDVKNGYHYIKETETKYRSNKDSSIITRIPRTPKHTFGDENYYSDQPNMPFRLFKVGDIIDSHITQNGYESMLRFDNDYFMLNSKGVVHYDSHTNSFKSFLEDIRVNTIFLDSENNAWISTANKGLFRISNLIEKLHQPRFNTYGGITSIEVDKYGNKYLGTLTGGVLVNPFKEMKFFNISKIQRPVQFAIHKNEVFAYDVNSLCKFETKTLNYELIPGELYRHKNLLIEDSIVWVGTSRGIFGSASDYYLNTKYKGGNIYLLNSRTSKIHKQKDSGKIYAGTINGLYTLENDSFRHIKNNALQSSSILNISDGDNSSIWISTRSQGVYNFRNDSILAHYSTENGFLSNNVNNTECIENELLVSTAAGLFIVDLITNKIKIISEHNYLPSDDVLVCKLIDDNYWIGTMEGLTILSKAEVSNIKASKPIISLKNLFVNGIEKDFEAGMKFDHTVNNIQLNLQNISYNSGKDKYIKYRIPKIDTSWISTKESIIRLPSLKPGNYDLEVFGVNSIGKNSDLLNLGFTINRPWWETLWARILGLLLLLSIGWGIFNFRIRQERQKREYLNQINNIKDQALQLQMNPHFIFNSLNAIQGFIGTDDEEMAMNYLARFARLIRLIFEHSKGNTITLEEELEFINLYLDLEKLRFKDKVNVEIMITPEVENNRDIINLPPLLIQPIIENSFKHGLFHKKGKGNIKIEFKMQGKLLQITIQDNGIGRVESEKLRKRNSEKQTSSGIKTTIERIDLLNLNNGKKINSVEIEDLYNVDGSAAGTRTSILLSV